MSSEDDQHRNGQQCRNNAGELEQRSCQRRPTRIRRNLLNICFQSTTESPVTLTMKIKSSELPLINAVSFSVTGATSVSYSFSDKDGNVVGEAKPVEIMSSSANTPVSDSFSTPVEAYTMTIHLTGESTSDLIRVSDFYVSACYVPGNDFILKLSSCYSLPLWLK